MSATGTDRGLRVLLWEIRGAELIGAACGEEAGRLRVWTVRQSYSEAHSIAIIGLAVSRVSG